MLNTSERISNVNTGQERDMRPVTYTRSTNCPVSPLGGGTGIILFYKIL